MTDKNNPWALVPRNFLKPFFEDFDLLPGSVGSYEEGLNVYETDKDVIVEAAVPGISAKQVDITVDNNVLTIKAQSQEKRQEEDKKRRYYVRGFQQKQFFYQVQLPSKVEHNKAEAEIKDGVLRVVLPKLAEAVSKKIQVKVK